jgi:hypothetical protein
MLRDASPRAGIRAALAARRSPSLHEIARRYDVRAISPRQMAALSEELYFAGFLSREQFADLAFQSELMPNYDTTIGALTGTRAEPDRPRDFTRVWKAKLAFEMKHLGDDPRIVVRTRKILELLRTIENPPMLPATIVPEAAAHARPRARRAPVASIDVPPVRLKARPDERW